MTHRTAVADARWLLGLLVAGFLAASPGSAAEPESVTPAEMALIQQAESARIAAIEKVYGAVVSIYGNDRQGGGSGVLFDERGYALTNFHVVSAAGDEGWAGLADGKLYRWKLLGFDPGGDLAVIRLTGKDRFPAAVLGNSGAVKVGDWAMAMGNPFTLAEDQKPTVTLGVVSAIERYQPGAGKNALVYGNCIQVDSSINPGNSGGPLFNMKGEIVGINGRGSFEERGRVNVGVGYAISSEQAKNFLPDLLATKICMHGTLDATFVDQDGETICNQLNVDSALARLGLQLGDRLIAFDGRPIVSANQFGNIISTLPAGWPVEVVFEHEGVRRSAWLRLDALPYEARKAAQAKEPAPGEDKEPKPAADAPSKVRQEVEPGQLRDPDVNREFCQQLVQTFAAAHTALSEPDRSLRGGRFEVERRDTGDTTAVDRRRWTWSADGRFREDMLDESGQATGASYGFDGTSFWRREADGKISLKQEEDFRLAKADHLPIMALAALFQENPSSAFLRLELEGADKVDGRRAYRLRGKLKSGQPVYLWYSVLDDAGRLASTPIKIAAEEDGKPAADGWILGNLSHGQLGFVPNRFIQVQGLSEKRLTEVTVTSSQAFNETVDEGLLVRPVDADSQTSAHVAP